MGHFAECVADVFGEVGVDGVEVGSVFLKHWRDHGNEVSSECPRPNVSRVAEFVLCGEAKSTAAGGG